MLMSLYLLGCIVAVLYVNAAFFGIASIKHT